MKILFAASEAVPTCKTGGLADVAGALPDALAETGTTVLRVLPLYRSIRKDLFKLTKLPVSIRVPVGRDVEFASLWSAPAKKNIKTIFIDAYRYFDRDGLYGHPPGTDFPDNDHRFMFFSRAILEAAKAVKFKPDVCHLHDWQTSLVPAYLKTLYRSDPFFSKTGSVFTIHNMAYQGIFPEISFSLTGLPASEFAPDKLEFYGQFNFMKGGLVYADVLSTVSPTYAKEIVASSERGFGLEGLLQHRSKRLFGIMNGLDTQVWNPETDPYLKYPFKAGALKNRDLCKLDLQKSVGLTADAERPVLGFVGRLDHQKGVHILIASASDSLRRGAQLVVLGVGNPDIQLQIQTLKNRFPAQVAFESTFAEPLAHKIYAGSDLFLMPSLFEPCGLGQMIAMRYGALPVVTPTGGLLDSVKPLPSKTGCGFVASDISSVAFSAAILSALQFLQNEKLHRAAQVRAMKTDFSWKKSVAKYLALYKKAQKWQREPTPK